MSSRAHGANGSQLEQPDADAVRDALAFAYAHARLGEAKLGLEQEFELERSR